MLIRKVRQDEIPELFLEGYKVWNKGRSFDKYCADNSKEDGYGVRYVVEENNNIISSLILLKLNKIGEYAVYGIGSVLTKSDFVGKGYATLLLKYSLQKITEKNRYVFLYSEINKKFYERLHFRPLPERLQKDGKAVCMVSCSDELWEKLLKKDINSIPEYF
ncbi:MAG: hypothetical protein K0S61_667 [Anaerocolumna sp.]|jgi:GNAT superfamily N-acetyltransferase|nr:hypothetical protein [Anaerocolumna sp.]